MKNKTFTVSEECDSYGPRIFIPTSVPLDKELEATIRRLAWQSADPPTGFLRFEFLRSTCRWVDKDNFQKARELLLSAGFTEG